MVSKTVLKVLMISTEYPPMKGGVGRYTYNLVKGLQNIGINTYVVSGDEGDGDYKGLYPFKKKNSFILLDIVNKLQPDIVHVQMEHGLYGLEFRSFFPDRMRTSINLFYSKCNRPIITTFHSLYDFKQWLSLGHNLFGINCGNQLKYGFKKTFNNISRTLKYKPFNNLNKRILNQSKVGIVFSNYLSNFLPGSRVIYHGSEPSINEKFSKKLVRIRLCLPEKGRIALCIGFATFAKGWDIINKMDIPENRTLILNYSKNHFNREKFQIVLNKNKISNKILNLEKDYLSEKDLSLLFLASDIVFLPYKVSSGSGVMFDSLAHGLPFLASNLGFFREFANLNLGITVKNEKLKELKWSKIAMKHYYLYKKYLDEEHMKHEILIK